MPVEPYEINRNLCDSDVTPKIAGRGHHESRNLEEVPCLAHNDFGNRNILVRQENRKCVVAAVLDWEFAFPGSPLLDVGHFLGYERRSAPLREPHFSQGVRRARWATAR